MTAILMNGKDIAADIKSDVVDQVKELANPPQLAVILVGEDAASKIYVEKKTIACSHVGIESLVCYLPYTSTTEEVIATVKRLQKRSEVSGILVQLPMPPHIDKFSVLNEINPIKDVDCFTPTNLGLLAQNRSVLQPCTPQAVLEMLKWYHISTAGKRITIINRSLVVGQPLATMLLRENHRGNATVTVCHDQTKPDELEDHTLNSDIIITAVGKPNAFRLTGHMVKYGAVVVDVGISRVDDKIVGDATEDVKDVASHLSSVPGGVGPVTCAMLVKNTVLAMKLQLGLL